jgi:hypothetical protein
MGEGKEGISASRSKDDQYCSGKAHDVSGDSAKDRTGATGTVDEVEKGGLR